MIEGIHIEGLTLFIIMLEGISARQVSSDLRQEAMRLTKGIGWEESR
jgi:hypothetical protein